MGTAGISERDVKQMLNITRDYAEDDGEVLPWELLHDLKKLVPCDNVEASWQDTPRWEFVDQDLPGVELSPAEGAAYGTAYKAHYWRSLCSYPDRTGDTAAVFRVSDLLPDREYRQTGLYTDLVQPFGLQHELFVCLDGGAPQRTVRLLFDRAPGSDFSDRDLAVVTLLRPHLQAAYDRAKRRRRAILPLTGRQREILQLVAAGHSNRQIARRLFVSEATVRKHLENIFSRLEVNSRTAAVARLTHQPSDTPSIEPAM
jgi:DNA-binding CsgD family transcriptional regulator